MDITAAVDRAKDTQLLRLNRMWRSDSGLSTIADDIAQYVYVTKRPLVYDSAPDGVWSDGKTRDKSDRCFPNGGAEWISNPIEIQPDGTERVLCLPHNFDTTGRKANIQLARLLPDGSFADSTGRYQTKALTVVEYWPMPLLLAGVDPASEQKLVGLDNAIVSGGLPATPRHYNLDTMKYNEFLDLPVLATTNPGLDETLTVSWHHLPSVPRPTSSILGGRPSCQRSRK